jgi:hypothetical protein
MHGQGRTAKRAGGLAALVAGLALYASSLGGIASIDGTLAAADRPDRPVGVVAEPDRPVVTERDCPYADRV